LKKETSYIGMIQLEGGATEHIGGCRSLNRRKYDVRQEYVFADFPEVLLVVCEIMVPLGTPLGLGIWWKLCDEAGKIPFLGTWCMVEVM
jgi:hypothetical protein